MGSRRLTVIVIEFAAVALIASCTGADGPTGPAGPAGPVGNQGPLGPQGPIGTANVISGQATVLSTDWSATTVQTLFATSNASTAGGDHYRFADVSVPAITSTVLAGGAILVWMESTSGVWAPLPFTFKFVLQAIENRYEVEFRSGSIRLLFSRRDLNSPQTLIDPLPIVQADRVFRWVIIPPAAVSTLRALPVSDGADATLAALAARGYRIERR